MNVILNSQQTGDYHVETPVYEGPLDLLLQLIERAELDITKVALAKVTDQYLAHLRNMRQRSSEELSAFLVIASRLLQIKSEALLPQPPDREEGEEDPGEALAQQLRLYKQFKQVAHFLSRLDDQGQHTFLRLAPPPRIEVKADLSEVNLSELLNMAHTALSRVDDRPELKTVVTPSPVTIRQKISLISRRLNLMQRVSFKSLLAESQSRIEIVVTFLAMLELIKRHLVRVHQDGLFGDIELEPQADWDPDLEFDLEFGE
jgi:segregation and condensation protein A